jgi:hypothetical protein
MSAPADRAHAIRLLAEDVRAEVERIEETVRECEDTHARFESSSPDRLELMGIGGLLQSFYNGIERALVRIAPEFNGGLPMGDAWHRRLLEQMTLAVPEVRPAVLRRDTAGRLHEYRAFRHRFRNLYFFDLRWEPCQKLLADVAEVWHEVREDLSGFVTFLGDLGRLPERSA